MDRVYNNKASQTYKSQQLTEEEKEELCVNSMRRVMPILIAIEEWRADSLYSPFRY